MRLDLKKSVILQNKLSIIKSKYSRYKTQLIKSKQIINNNK